MSDMVFTPLINGQFISRCQGWMYPSRMQCTRAGEFIEESTGLQYCKHHMLVKASNLEMPPQVVAVEQEAVEEGATNTNGNSNPTTNPPKPINPKP
jgi:hypothetical protein